MANSIFDNNAMLNMLGGPQYQAANDPNSMNSDQIQAIKNYGQGLLNEKLPPVGDMRSPWQAAAYALDKFQGRNELNRGMQLNQGLTDQADRAQTQGLFPTNIDNPPATPGGIKQTDNNGAIINSPTSPDQQTASGSTDSSGNGTPSSDLLDHIRKYESFRNKAYPDNSQYSVGYGTKARYPGEVIDQAEGERRLEQEVSAKAAEVNKVIPNAPQNIKDVLTSLSYNVGTGGWANNTALVRAANSGDTATVAKILPQYSHDSKNGQLVFNQGLYNRRNSEAQWLLNSGNTPNAVAAVNKTTPTQVADLSGKAGIVSAIAKGMTGAANQAATPPAAIPPDVAAAASANSPAGPANAPNPAAGGAPAPTAPTGPANAPNPAAGGVPAPTPSPAAAPPSGPDAAPSGPAQTADSSNIQTGSTGDNAGPYSTSVPKPAPPMSFDELHLLHRLAPEAQQEYLTQRASRYTPNFTQTDLGKFWMKPNGEHGFISEPKYDKIKVGDVEVTQRTALNPRTGEPETKYLIPGKNGNSSWGNLDDIQNHQGDIKAQQSAKQEAATKGTDLQEKMISDDTEAGDKAQKVQVQVGILQDIQRKAGLGDLFTGPYAKQVADVKKNINALMPGTFDSDTIAKGETINKLTTNIAGALSHELTNRATQFDFKTYLGSTPSLENSPKGQKMLADLYQAMASQDAAIGAMAYKYGKNPDGYMDAKIQFYKQHPITVEAPDGKIVTFKYNEKPLVDGKPMDKDSGDKPKLQGKEGGNYFGRNKEPLTFKNGKLINRTTGEEYK